MLCSCCLFLHWSKKNKHSVLFLGRSFQKMCEPFSDFDYSFGYPPKKLEFPVVYLSGFFYQSQAFVKVIIGHKWLHMVVKSKPWLLNSSKATDWYYHPCDDNITLATFEGSQISWSKFIPFAQSKNVAWTRKLVLEIASKVQYLVLFFLLHIVSFFLHLNSFFYYLMPCNRLVSVEWIPSESLKIAVTGVETDWQITKMT